MVRKGDIVVFNGRLWIIATGYLRSDGLYKAYSLDGLSYAYLNKDLWQEPSGLLKELF